jgi:hypothetical protein
MKQLLVFGIIFALIFLSACGEYDTGNVYSHLQNQNVIVDNSKDEVNTQQTLDESETEAFNQEIQRLCSGEYTQEEEQFRILEQDAIAQQNELLCEELPDTPLVFFCEGKEIIFYSKDRCLAYFAR